MIPLEKLAKLSPRHRMRKAALVLTGVERELLGVGESAASATAYAIGLASLIAREAEAPAEILDLAKRLAAQEPKVGEGLLRAIDALRHALISATGQAPGDWDLIDPGTGKVVSDRRPPRPGLRAYLEDLRSPFNVGSVFRTAEAFGVEELFLSPETASPDHPRARRSAMGAIDLVPWRRAELGELIGGEGVFALELGGESIDDFAFPERGMVVIGSEELGVSGDALSCCRLGTVSIPMFGAKGSLNAAVAFGILMHAWTSRLDRKRQY